MKKIKTRSPQTRFHVRSGDTVEVIAGNHKTKSGRVLSVDRQRLRARIEGVGMIKKHARKSKQDPNGGIVQTEGSIHVSNLKVLEKYKYVPAKKK